MKSAWTSSLQESKASAALQLSDSQSEIFNSQTFKMMPLLISVDPEGPNNFEQIIKIDVTTIVEIIFTVFDTIF